MLSSNRDRDLLNFSNEYFTLRLRIDDSPNFTEQTKRSADLLKFLSDTLISKRFQNKPEIENAILNQKIGLDELIHDKYQAEALPDGYETKKPSTWKENHIAKDEISSLATTDIDPPRKKDSPSSLTAPETDHPTKKRKVSERQIFLDRCKITISRCFSSIQHNQRPLERTLQEALEKNCLQKVLMLKINNQPVWEMLSTHREQLNLAPEIQEQVARIQAIQSNLPYIDISQSASTIPQKINTSPSRFK